MEINVSNVSVRRVGDTDIEEMVTHRLAYLIEMQGNRDESYLKNLKKELKDYFQRNIHSGNFIALIAETEGQILGYGGMVIRHIPGDLNKSSYLEGDILNMYTLPHARKMGVGALILEHLLSEARTMGMSKVALHTSKDGEKLYRNYGFSEPVAYPFLELIL